MKKFFGFKGRMRRRDYAFRQLGVLLVQLVIVGTFEGRPEWLLAASPVLLLAFWIGIPQTMRRLHDIDLPGYWVLLLLTLGVAGQLVPPPLVYVFSGVCWWSQVWFFFKRGTVGENQYGPDPIPNLDLANVQSATQ
jgi:uncharacterized membrane protein YhaH (DUF805 family)